MRLLLRSLARLPHGTKLVFKAVGAAAAGGVCLAAWGQGITVVPSLTIEETLTNNREQSATDRHADLITRVTPGLSFTSRHGALQGSLTYSLNGVLYAQDS